MTAGEGERPLVNIVGERVALGPLRRDLAPLLLTWMNEFYTQRTSGYPGRPEPWTTERMAAWFDSATVDQHRAWFTVYETAGWRPIGHANLRDMDYQHRTAEFGITIGALTDRGQGYGTEATRLILDYAFTALGLNNVLLDVTEFNQAGRRAYLKAGFKEIGRRRQAYWMGGRLWDVIFMDCLADEFTSPVLSRVFVPDEVR